MPTKKTTTRYSWLVFLIPYSRLSLPLLHNYTLLSVTYMQIFVLTWKMSIAPLIDVRIDMRKATYLMQITYVDFFWTWRKSTWHKIVTYQYIIHPSTETKTRTTFYNLVFPEHIVINWLWGSSHERSVYYVYYVLLLYMYVQSLYETWFLREDGEGTQQQIDPRTCS